MINTDNTKCTECPHIAIEDIKDEKFRKEL